jgi:hypothetical protein
MKRIYHPYQEWEEMGFNMWGDVSDRKHFLGLAIELTGDHKRYGSFMLRVVNEWVRSCENALTDSFINRKAWVGHAAVALAIQCPEDITREAWGHLSDEQQLLANKEAERAIQAWEYAHFKDRRVCDGVGEPMLF